ncbi:hypothetical protein FRC19_001708 [Serendipita sp. 401]|nr:hypothetical protein FRC19_001708 [Serendipita sp. 401]
MSSSPMHPYHLRQEDFPITLYRVHYPGSQTTFSEHFGFQSASNFTPYRTNGLRNAVTYHIDWQCNTPSPFISTFSNREHALNWARIWRGNHNLQDCQIVELRILANDGVAVFRLADLVNALGITTTLEPSQYRSEYLCFHNIPARAVVRTDSVSYPVAFSGYARVVDWNPDDD